MSTPPSVAKPSRKGSLPPHLLVVLALVLGLLAAPTLRAQSGAVPDIQENDVLSLEQCVAYALANQQAIREARFDILVADQDVRAVLGAAYPQLSASWDLNYFAEIPQTPVPATFSDPNAEPGDLTFVQFGTEYTSSAGLNLQQVIFDGTVFIGLRAARGFKELQRKNLMRTEVEAVSQVTKAYYTVLVNRARVQLLRNSQDQLKRQLDDTRILYENGFAEKLDVQRLEVQYNNLKTDITNAEAGAAISLDVLKFQMGLMPRIQIDIVDNLDTDNTADLTENADLAGDPTRRVEYQTFQQALELQELQRRADLSAYLPKLYATGSVQANNNRNDFGEIWSERWFPTVVFGVSLQWNIFDGFRAQAEGQKSKIEMARIESQRENFERSVDLEVAQYRTELESAVRELDNQQRNLELADEVYRVTQIKFKEGVGTNTEVLNAETERRTALNNYVDALLQAYLAKVNLEEALGVLYQPTEQLENLESLAPLSPAEAPTN